MEYNGYLHENPNLQTATGAMIDYDVELIEPGDWWNYTRTFGDGASSANWRVSSSADGEFELGVVRSNVSQENQSVATIGQFKVPGRPGYQAITLSDRNQALASFSVSGEFNQRVTSVSGNDAAIN